MLGRRLGSLSAIAVLATFLSIALGAPTGQAQLIGGINFALLEGHAAPVYYQPEMGEQTAASFANFYDVAIGEVSNHFETASLRGVPVYIFLNETWKTQGLRGIFRVSAIDAAHSHFAPAVYVKATSRDRQGNVETTEGILVDAKVYQETEEAQKYMTLIHELTHAAIQSYMPSVQDQAPRWLDEGVATYLEVALGARRFPVEAGADAAAHRRALLDAQNNVLGTRLYSFDEIAAARDWDRIQLSPSAQKVLYAQSFTAVSLLAERAGWPAVVTALTLIGQRIPASEAIAQATGWPLEAMTEELRARAAADAARTPPAVRFTVAIAPGGSGSTTSLVITSRIGNQIRTFGTAPLGAGQYTFQIAPNGEVTSSDGRARMGRGGMGSISQEGVLISIWGTTYRGSRGAEGYEAIHYRYDYGVYTPVQRYYRYTGPGGAEETLPGLASDPFPDGNSVSDMTPVS